jgi:hypothetical protein
VQIPLWHRLYTGRLAWAEEAYTEFLADIDPALVEDFRRQNEITVVLYGPTQVGKTTLLLKLLGIGAEQEVARILRGGSKAGEAATATAVRYSRSPDECWYIGPAGGTPLSDDQVETALANMRATVVAGDYIAVDPVPIFIPRRYFAQVDAVHHVRVLDLPGYDAAPAGSPEGDLVSRIARKHVRTADLIILIASVNDLGALKPGRLQLEELKDWAKARGRVRVVATHTVSGASFRRWLGRPGNAVKSQVRSLLAEEIRSLDIPVPPELEEILYPLEYGRSWGVLEQTAPDIFAKAQPIVDELFLDLSADVRDSATPHGRLRMAFTVHRALTLKAEGRLKEFDSEASKLRGLKVALGRRLKAASAYIRAKQSSIASLDKQQHTLGDNARDGMARMANAFQADSEIPEGRSVQAFEDFIADAEDRLAMQWKALAAELHQILPCVRLKKVEHSTAFEAIGKTLREYSFDRYFFNYDRDRHLVIGAQQEAIDKARRSATQQLEKAITARTHVLEEENKAAASELAYARKLYAGRKARWSGAHTQLHTLKLDRAAYQEGVRYEIEKARQFGTLLNGAFHQELARHVHIAATANQPVTTFLHLCHVNLLYREFDKLTAGSLHA